MLAKERCMAMTKEDLLRLFGAINVWRRGDERAPHKPLLALMALGRLQAGERWLPFHAIDVPLKELLKAYGRPERNQHSEYPFWRLQNDGIWEIPGGKSFRRREGQTDALRSELLRHEAKGGFTQDVYDALREDPVLIVEAAHQILTANFPESLHDDIVAAVGLSLEPPPVVRDGTPVVARDPAFHDSVIRAYGHQCAVCGYDGRIGSSDLALEAAHIKWHAAGGPSVVENGLALCSFHHKALDLGALSLDTTHSILVSEHVHGAHVVDVLLLDFAGRPLHRPLRKDYLPAPVYVDWHNREVFRSPARKPTL
jgi:putative restriction endonuclease